MLKYFPKVRGDEQPVTNWGKLFHRVVQQSQRLCLQVMNDVLLAPQRDVSLLQQQAEWHLAHVGSAAPCHEDSRTPERTTCRAHRLYVQEHEVSVNHSTIRAWRGQICTEPTSLVVCGIL